MKIPSYVTLLHFYPLLETGWGERERGGADLAEIKANRLGIVRESHGTLRVDVEMQALFTWYRLVFLFSQTSESLHHSCAACNMKWAGCTKHYRLFSPIQSLCAHYFPCRAPLCVFVYVCVCVCVFVWDRMREGYMWMYVCECRQCVCVHAVASLLV